MTRFNRVIVASAFCAIAVMGSLRVPISGADFSDFYCADGETYCSLTTGSCNYPDACNPAGPMFYFSTCYAQKNSTCTESGDQITCSGTCVMSMAPCTFTRNLCDPGD